jgi:transcriptional regulator with XRE-family HTH domain
MSSAPTTVTDLADRLGVNRRRVAKWRQGEGAPADLDLDHWRAWLRRTGRTAIAARLDQVDAPLAEVAPEKPAGAIMEAAMPAPPAEPDTLQKPLPDAPQIDWDRYWKAYGNRERALTAQNERLKEDRVLIHRDEVAALLNAQATAQLATLGDTVWLAMRPLLDGVPESLRRSLRTAHDQAVLDVRSRLVQAVRDSMRAAVSPPAKGA